MLITVHDEIMGECAENAELSRKTFKSHDRHSKAMKAPMKCDTYIVSHWCTDEMTASIQAEYKNLVKRCLKRCI